jgi:hypothetical protein
MHACCDELGGLAVSVRGPKSLGHAGHWVRAAVAMILVNLDKPGHFIHWWVIQLSVANLAVIVLMVVVFVLALLVPFPKPHERHGTKEDRS